MSATPNENRPIINPIKAAAPIIISITPMNFAKTLKKNIITSPIVSKKVLEDDFIELALFFTSIFFAALETESDTFFATSPTVSVTVSNPSLIFFSMLLILTGSPVIIIFSAVVFASGTKTQSKI